MPITIAVPTYNGLVHLQRLIPQLQSLGFDDIVILDDCSTDGSAQWLGEQSGITTVIGTENLGPTANRNRVLSLNTRNIILFLDVDMELTSQAIPAALEQAFATNPKTAVVGALITSQTGEPMWYNWGYDMTPYLSGYTSALNDLALAHWHDPEVMATIREQAQGKIGHFEPVRSHTVDWVVEQFFAVKADVFRQLGGFDTNFRMFHEGPDYCRRARLAGYSVYFTTTITARHLDQHSGNDDQRQADSLASTKYYYRKHFGISDELYDNLFA